MNQIKDFLKRNRLIMDGAMGTYYAQKFARRGEPSEIGNFDAPDAIRAIHMEYIKAGANLIRTNTFASNYQTLKRSGYGGESHNPGEVVKRNLTWDLILPGRGQRLRTPRIYRCGYRACAGVRRQGRAGDIG